MSELLLERLRELARPNGAWYGLGAAIVLSMIGVVAIGTVEPGYSARQAQFWLPVALVVMTLCMLPHPRLLRRATYPMAMVMLGLLVFVILPFAPRAIVPVINGATSWIDLGPMNFQPAEIAKIVFVLALALYLRYRDSYRTLRGLIVPFLFMFVPVGLLLKQPDLGTAMLFAPTLFVMLVAAGAKLRHLGALISIGMLVVTVNVAVIALDAPPWMRVLKPHQEARIAAMLNPARHADDADYQRRISMTLVGAGGVEGLGADRSRTILQFNHLPEDHNDMIFAVVVNRWGLIGAIVVIGNYLVLTGSFVLVASRIKDPFGRLTCVGFGGLIFTQAAINIGVTTGILPTTGITLPLVSYGGSSLVATFAMVGLVMNFASRRTVMISRPSFEFDRADAITP